MNWSLFRCRRFFLKSPPQSNCIDRVKTRDSVCPMLFSPESKHRYPYRAIRTVSADTIDQSLSWKTLEEMPLGSCRVHCSPIFSKTFSDRLHMCFYSTMQFRECNSAIIFKFFDKKTIYSLSFSPNSLYIKVKELLDSLLKKLIKKYRINKLKYPSYGSSKKMF